MMHYFSYFYFKFYNLFVSCLLCLNKKHKAGIILILDEAISLQMVIFFLYSQAAFNLELCDMSLLLLFHLLNTVYT